MDDEEFVLDAHDPIISEARNKGREVANVGVWMEVGRARPDDFADLAVDLKAKVVGEASERVHVLEREKSARSRE